MKIHAPKLHTVGTLLFVAAGIGAVLTVAGWSSSRHSHPEIPVMQSFSATPRFADKIEICGQKVDLRRYDLHERFERELTAMCYTHNTTLLTLKRANRILPQIVPILKEEKVPEDLIYLAAIESSLNVRAYSSAKAAGLWQFMPETAKRYGLEVTDEVDERYHIAKSTHAACRYLKEAYAKYGDWMSAVCSYNAGQARITKQLQEQQASSALDLLLVEETSRYPFRMMAMKEVMSDPYRYGYVLTADQLYRPIRTKEVKVTQSIESLADFAKKHKCSYLHLKDFNPWLRSTKLTVKGGKSYTLLIPDPDDMKYDGKSFPIYNEHWVIDKH
jgi:hypothetical protein